MAKLIDARVQEVLASDSEKEKKKNQVAISGLVFDEQGNLLSDPVDVFKNMSSEENDRRRHEIEQALEIEINALMYKSTILKLELTAEEREHLRECQRNMTDIRASRREARLTVYPDDKLVCMYDPFKVNTKLWLANAEEMMHKLPRNEWTGLLIERTTGEHRQWVRDSKLRDMPWEQAKAKFIEHFDKLNTLSEKDRTRKLLRFSFRHNGRVTETEIQANQKQFRSMVSQLEEKIDASWVMEVFKEALPSELKAIYLTSTVNGEPETFDALTRTLSHLCLIARCTMSSR